MSSGSGLATALAALKAHAAAATIVGALVVGGGTAATVAVTTGAVHVPGINTHQQSSDKDSGANATPRATACANNGDAQRLAAIFYPMFDGDKTKAQAAICALFVGTNGQALGMGEIQQTLETTAAIELNGGSTACLTASSDHGKPAGAGTPASGHATFSAPSATTTTTMKIVGQVLADEQHGTPLAQLAKNCGAVSATGNPNDNGNGQANGTPGAKPDKTPGPKPTHTPGHP